MIGIRPFVFAVGAHRVSRGFDPIIVYNIAIIGIILYILRYGSGY